MVFKSIPGAVCACLMVASFNANAEIISVDWKTTGDNLITRDTVSGLVWLDLTETLNLSYSGVSSQFTFGGEFEGWRYASIFEINTLLMNYTGVHFDPNYWGEVDYDEGLMDGMIELLGATGTDGGLNYTWGMHSTSPYQEIWKRAAYLHNDDRTIDGRDFSVANNGLTNSNESRTDMGSFLVKSSVVPIPAAVWLFGSGLIGLIGLAKRK